MRVPRSSVFISGSFLLCTAPLWAQNGAAPAAPAAPAARTTVAWSTFKGDAQRTGSSAANVKLPLALTWRYTSEAPARTYTTSPLVLGVPGRQRVVFGAGRNVYCLDVQTGAQVWRSPDLTSNIVTPLTLLSGDAGDLIVTAQQGGKVTALRGSDGGRAWEGDALASITDAGPVVVNTAGGQRIVVATSAGRLIAFKLDGAIDNGWKVSLGAYGISPTSSITLSADGSLLFIVASNAKLYAVDIQKAALAYSLQLAANSSVAPVVSGDQVITSNVQRVSAYRASSGAAAWEFNPQGEIIGSPSLGKDAAGKTVLFFGTREGAFYALDEAGKQIWKTEVGAGFTSAPLVLPSLVVAGTSNGLLIGLNPTDGAMTWQYRLKTERYTPPTTNVAFGGGRGGGFGGGRGGGRFGGGANTQAQPTTRIWGVSAAPSAIDGQMFVLGDNASLYSFTTQPFDAAAPRVIEPSLAVPDQQNVIAPLLLQENRPLLVPGRGPMYFAAQLEDTGSGVNPTTFKVAVDDVAVPATSLDWDMADGVLTVTLLDPAKGTVAFPDGLKNLTLSAKDYAGNELKYSISFLIDNREPAPAAGGNNNGGRGGFGGRGGGGGGGGRNNDDDDNNDDNGQGRGQGNRGGRDNDDDDDGPGGGGRPAGGGGVEAPQ